MLFLCCATHSLPLSPAGVVLLAFIVEQVVDVGKRVGHLLKKVSKKKGNEKREKKKNLLNAQETSYDVSWAFPYCVLGICLVTIVVPLDPLSSSLKEVGNMSERLVF